MGSLALTPAEQAALDVTIREAEQACRAEISVFIGDATGDARDFSTSLHNTLVLPSRSILIMVDPTRRIVEIVTGGHVRERLSDDEVGAAVQAMTTHFTLGELAKGLGAGIEHLAAHASS